MFVLVYVKLDKKKMKTAFGNGSCCMLKPVIAPVSG